MTRAALLEVFLIHIQGAESGDVVVTTEVSFDLFSKSDQSSDDGGEKVKWNLLKKISEFFFKKKKRGAEKKNQCLVITELVTH